jgi:hypothetical protein
MIDDTCTLPREQVHRPDEQVQGTNEKGQVQDDKYKVPS